MKVEVKKPTENEIEEAQNWSTWSKEVSEFPWSYQEKETCLILKGEAEVENAEGEKFQFGAGDFVIFPKGVECVWKIKEKIEKKYKFGD